MSESETTSASNWKVSRDGKTMRLSVEKKVTFTLDFRKYEKAQSEKFII